MSRFLSQASRVCIALLIVGGAVVTVGQIIGIATADADVVTAFGTTGVSIICVTAGLAGVFSFLRYYTREGKAEAAAEEAE